VASQGAEPLALEYMNTADGLRRAQDLVGRQTGSFDTAANSVTPVPPEPTSSMSSTPLWSAGHTTRSATTCRPHSTTSTSTPPITVPVSTTHQPPMDYVTLAVDQCSVITTEPTVSTPMSVALAAPAGTRGSTHCVEPNITENHFRQCRRAKPIVQNRHCSARTSSGDRADSVVSHRRRHRVVTAPVRSSLAPGHQHRGQRVAMEPNGATGPFRAVWVV